MCVLHVCYYHECRNLLEDRFWSLDKNDSRRRLRPLDVAKWTCRPGLRPSPRPSGTFTLRLSLLLYCCMSHGCPGYCLYSFCVVVCSLPGNRFVTLLHVVSHCSSYYHASHILCLLSVFMLVPSFVNLGRLWTLLLFCIFTSAIVGDASVDFISKC